MSFKLKNIPGPGFYTAQSDGNLGGKTGTGAFDKVAPDGYHATTIFPEYFKVGVSGCWQRKAAWTAWRYLRMGKSMSVIRNLKRVTWYSPGGKKTERKEFLYILTASGNLEGRRGSAGGGIAFPARGAGQRETAFSRDYDNIYELLEYEKEHGCSLGAGIGLCLRCGFKGSLLQARDEWLCGCPAGRECAGHP